MGCPLTVAMTVGADGAVVEAVSGAGRVAAGIGCGRTEGVEGVASGAGSQPVSASTTATDAAKVLMPTA